MTRRSRNLIDTSRTDGRLTVAARRFATLPASIALSFFGLPSVAAAAPPMATVCIQDEARSTEQKLLTDAATADDPYVLAKLGDFYRLNPACDPGHTRALHFLNVASTGGNAWAMIAQARILLGAEGPDRDVKRALDLLETAGRAGLGGPAFTMIGGYYRTSGDYARALEQFERASAAGSGWGKRELAKMLLAGEGGKPDPRRAIELLEEAAKTDARGPALTTLGAYFRSIGDFDKAIGYFEEAAATGDASAKKAWGDMLLAGEATGGDPSRGVKLLQEAADGGLAGPALVSLADYFETAGNMPMAIGYLQQAVDLGDDAARIRLAKKLFAGRDLPADPDRGIALLHDAAKGLRGPALAALGGYYKSIGDYQKAEASLGQAADAGDKSAILNLVDLLLRDSAQGDGDAERAVALLERVSVDDLGAPALLALGSYYRSVGRFEEAMGPLMLAAEAGQALAMKEGAEMLLYGEGTPPNPLKAISLLQRAIDAGLKGPALNTLGDYYRTTGDFDMAITTLQAAVDLGEPWAMKNLAEMLLAGQGTPIDVAKADRLMDRAAQMPPPPRVRMKWVSDPPSTYSGVEVPIETVMDIAFKAGFRSEEQLLPIVALAITESGLFASARNWQPRKGLRPKADTVGVLGPPQAWSPDGRQMHSDRGLWQISSYWWSQYDDHASDDPATAASIAYKISNRGTDFDAWSSFQSGDSKKLYDKDYDGWPALRPLVQEFIASELSKMAPAQPDEKKVERALDLLRKAAEKGLPGPAFATMGRHYRHIGDRPQALDHLKHAAQLGDAGAITAVAEIEQQPQPSSGNTGAAATFKIALRAGVTELASEFERFYELAGGIENVAAVASEASALVAVAFQQVGRSDPETAIKRASIGPARGPWDGFMSDSWDVAATLDQAPRYDADLERKPAVSSHFEDQGSTISLASTLLAGSNRKDASDRAIALLEKASAAGATREAQTLLGNHYRKTGQASKAASALKLAVEAGQHDAIVDLLAVLATGRLDDAEADAITSLVAKTVADKPATISDLGLVPLALKNFQYRQGVELALQLVRNLEAVDRHEALAIVLSLNDNRKTSLAQSMLAGRGAYLGPLHGMLDKPTLTSIGRFCKSKRIAVCRRNPLPDQLFAALLESDIYSASN